MFGLKELFARSKPIQYSSYVIVLTLIIAAKLYPRPDVSVAAPEPQSISVEQQAPTLTTTVDLVVDGDTFIAGGISYRLAMIDAPEADQAFGEEAAAFLRGLVSDTEIAITESHQDRYGRTIAHASINGISISELLIENGYAWPYMVVSAEDERKLTQLQEAARAGELGLWVDPNPVRPSVYRELKKYAANNE